MKDQEVQQKFVELRGQGWSFDRIAQELNVSKPTLIGWARKYKVEINNLRSLALDALNEQFALTIHKRLEILGELLERLKAEAMVRDLSSIPTHKAFDLIMKISEIIKAENPQIQFQKEEEFNKLEELIKNEESGKRTVSWEA
ncbi:MAG: hypothetical protein KC643_30850 [Nitrospira sp.]|nr:hypothetical protein [Nitrospira sp.]